MKILHFGSIYPNKASGLSFSIPNLIHAQNTDKSSPIAYLYNTKNSINFKNIELNQYSVIVLHSFFIPGYLKLIFKIPKNIKIIICPRGAFSISNNYGLKKKIYSVLYFLILKIRNLNYSIHFLTENERIKSRFRSKGDFVVGNSIEIQTSAVDVDFLRRKFDNKKIVYVGRFDSKIKGLDLLLLQIIDNKEIIKSAGFELHMYGPDSNDKKGLQSMSNKNNLDMVHFHDTIFESEKKDVLDSAFFHILNSRSEGFPMTVLESTKYFTPQLLSKGTNLQQTMIMENFGFSVDYHVFENLKNLSFEEYKTMAINARNFAMRHSFKEIGNETNKKYFQ